MVLGFFEHAALRATLACGRDLKKLFFALMALCGVVSALFANDAAVLILAPIILAQTRALNHRHAQRLRFYLLLVL